MPENGAIITPPWIGFHGGNSILFDTGSEASKALESIAEDGNPGNCGRFCNMVEFGH
jgi:hypothetical protein